MNRFSNALNIIRGVGIGAATMYVLDPNRGHRRRAVLADAVASSLRDFGDALDVASRDMLNRSRGVAAEAWRLLPRDIPSDPVLRERVRSKLGRLSSHPHAIEVTAEHGKVTLRGHCLLAEVDRVVSGVASIPGVLSIQNELKIHETSEGVPDLQGESGRQGERFALMQKNWPPATRLLAGTAGMFLAISGIQRGGVRGALRGLLGVAFLTRAASNMEFAQLIGKRGSKVIDLQKTVHINAPVEEVYRFWQHLKDFPRIMSHVYGVEPIGEGRHRWTVAGPAGLPLSWISATTIHIPNKVIGWRSEPGSVVQCAGVVRFDYENSGTRLHVRMSYNPPGGAIGHAVALLFGADPKHAMDDDLGRFKSLIEIGKTRAHGEHVTREEWAG
jgi:uncharacterized membrane protein